MTIRFAVVGFGYIGQRHAAIIQSLPAAKLVAVVEPSSERHFPADIPVFETLDQFLKSGIMVDVVSICTPNGFHYRQCMEALTYGAHILCEKPLALEHRHCLEIIQLADRLGKKVFCVMQNRYSPPAQWLRSLLKEKKLGEIYAVQTTCFWNRDTRYYKPNGWHGSRNLDGGTLFTQFSHFVDILMWLFGELSLRQASFWNHNHQGITEFEDSGLIVFDLPTGGYASLAYSTAVWEKNWESSLSVLAEWGSIKIGGQYMNEVQYCHVRQADPPVLPPTNPPNDYGSYLGTANNHNMVITNVIEVLTADAPIMTTADEAAKVVALIEAAYRENPFLK